MAGMVVLQTMEPPDQNDPPEPLTPAHPLPHGVLPVQAQRSEPSFTLTRETVTFGDLVSQASTAWQRDVGTWVLATVFVLLIGFGIPLVLGLVVGILGALLSGGDPHPAAKAIMTGLQVGVQILQTVVQGVLALGFWAMAIHALHGRPAPIGALFSQINKAVKYILQVLAIWIPLGAVFGAIGAAVFFLSVGSIDLDMPLEDAFETAAPALSIFLLVSIPIYVYIFLGILFAQPELTYNDRAGPIEAVVYSWRIARKRRWLVLGVAIVSGLIGMGSILFCGIGFLFGGPLATLIMAALYLALRNGADVPSADTGSTLDRAY